MIEKILTEIEKQSNTHPDPSLREFYKVYLKLYPTHTKTKMYLEKVTTERKGMEIHHLANLIYRATQYVLIYKYNKKDMSTYTQDTWEEVIKDILDTEDIYNILLEKTLKENTQTNIYQRYLGPRAVLAKKFKKKQINIVDLGCSQNFGLTGIELNYPFLKIKDNTKNNELTKLEDQNLNIKSAIGIDIENPKDKSDWAMACRFYPKELQLFDSENQMIRYFKKQAKITKFIQCSVLEMGSMWKKEKLPKADAVIASLVLYQLPAELKEQAIGEIHKILKSGGVLIINDFVKTNSHIKWNVPWFENGQSNYKTIVLEKKKVGFLEPLEYIIWDSGRCLEACPGKDFHRI